MSEEYKIAVWHPLSLWNFLMAIHNTDGSESFATKKAIDSQKINRLKKNIKNRGKQVKLSSKNLKNVQG